MKPSQWAFADTHREHLVEKRRIYIMTCGDFQKVGIAADVKFRLRQIQAMNPMPVVLHLHRSVSRASAVWVERYIHQQLAPYHVHGEWFKAPLVAVEQATIKGCSHIQAKINRAVARVLAERYADPIHARALRATQGDWHIPGTLG